MKHLPGFLFPFAALFAVATPALAEKAPITRPNVLIIMADDCTFSDLPLYGGKNAETPNLDRLAAESLTFDHAYLAEAMCQPCRAELYTGQYPMRNGCAWNHSGSRPGVKSLPHHLAILGYRVGLSGKGHVKPAAVFPFENVPGFEKSCVRKPTHAHDLAPLRTFISPKKDTDRFCLVVALVEPHVPWVMGDPTQYPPKKIQLPPNIADTSRTREDFGKYLAEITYMDSQVGDILDALEESGQAEDTLVLFTSEQGSQFPGCKWTNWDTGLHTALIARWPGITPIGKRTPALVQYADVVPTLIELAGGDPETIPDLDGSSFANVLIGKKNNHREFVYGIHNNLPEGPPYPTRTVSDGTFRYIRNLTPDELYIEKHVMGTRGNGALNNPYWGTWVWASQTDPATYNLVKRYQSRPAEQLYHTTSDPYEMRNLANNPEFAEKKKELAAELDRWMKSQGDPGAPQDTPEALQAARKGEHLYYPPPATPLPDH